MELNQAIKDSAANGDRVAIAAVVVWLLVTLLKSDYVPIDFAPKVRPWLARKRTAV